MSSLEASCSGGAGTYEFYLTGKDLTSTRGFQTLIILMPEYGIIIRKSVRGYDAGAAIFLNVPQDLRREPRVPDLYSIQFPLQRGFRNQDKHRWLQYPS
jgi:hypothetical protein